MTAQIGDIIKIKWRKNRLACEPFEDYIDEKTGIKPEFVMQNTGCRRGYIAKWKISHNILYLTQIDGNLSDDSKATLTTLFPDSKGKVIAKWFTGELYIPTGPLLKYVHMGYASVHSKVLIITVEKGVVSSQKTIKIDKQDKSLFGDLEL